MKFFVSGAMFVMMVVCLSGCATKVEKYVFPEPPEKARFEFIGAYNSSASFKEGYFSALVAADDEDTLLGPMGIKTNTDGRLLVADIHRKKVYAMVLESESVSKFTDYEFNSVVGVETDRQGQVYVADGEMKNVSVFSPAGKLLRTIGDKDLFGKPVWLAVNDELDRIYVSDPVDHDIKVFSLAGEFLFAFGGEGELPGKFNAPQGMAFDNNGQLFVADMFNARVQVFNAEGEYLRHFGERGTNPQQFENPKDLAFDSEGNLYITDTRRPSFRVFRPDGTLLLVVGAPWPTGHVRGFQFPTGIHVDNLDRVFIADILNHRVAVWQYLSAAHLQRVQSQ